ncbi:GGDEF domain-containing protein [Novipirellula artificiosorum]|uniref:diguanylate cyclase n=1 Tax=Novipirellula artificiosorum TaxID=2528016 RepID=A0A5C6DVD6_9BACT|nr:GGDEF domain-containing protein [Novipirellula artificiosorum]TWU40660.1 Diguanylate cyclase DosC [Novipirellula artificiosorum]
MLKLYLATIRFALAIFCIAISFVLGAKILGFLPDLIHGNSRLIIRWAIGLIVSGIGVYSLLIARLFSSMKVSQLVASRVSQSLDALTEGLVVIDENERIVLANRAFSDTIGVPQPKLVGRRVSSLRWVGSPTATVHDCPWVRASEQSWRQTDQRMRYHHPDGSFRVLCINASPIKASDATPGGVLATFRDVTMMEEHHAELEQMVVMLRNTRDEVCSKNRELQVLATCDALTGCQNRRALFAFLDKAWARMQQEGTSLACLMFDNDHFKQVNDTYGHQIGDEVLQRVAAVLQEAFPEPSIACRYGGEEFCVVMTDVTESQAVAAAEQARKQIEQLRFEEPAELRVSASIGVSMSEFGARDPQEMINQADRCLYVAKEQGRNQVVAFDEVVDQSTQSSQCVGSNATRKSHRPTETVQGIVALLDAIEGK